ncbi:MAG: ATP-binding protein [Cellvibrionaceae bacterium]
MAWLKRFWLQTLWPKKLLPQMIVWVILALFLAQGISSWLLTRAYQERMAMHSELHFSRQFGAMITLLEQVPSELRPTVLKAWKRPGLRYQFLPQLPPAAKAESRQQRLREMRVERLMLKKLGEAYRGRIEVRLRLGYDNDNDNDMEPFSQRYEQRHEERFRPSREHPRPPFRPRERLSSDQAQFERSHRGGELEKLMLAVKLNNGQWFVAVMAAPDLAPLAIKQALNFVLVASVLVLLVLLVLFFQIRKITRPLSSLAAAADDIGRGRNVAPLKEEGPADIRDTVVAFNQMNDRLQRFVSDRTRMLAALSHDLRTPMTSMRLRLELMDDGDEKQRLLESLDEMQQMSEASLAFVRHSGDVEPTQKTDLTALLESVCDDLQDLGLAVQCDRLDAVVMALRPVSVKRALRNLIENAVYYGERARVALAASNDQVLITIIDRGPGIDPSEMESVFEPFVRLEQSRSRQTGGMGLGLSIARQVIRNHGGDVTLDNLESGLKVSVSLPL